MWLRQVTCFHYEGIDAIQRALLKGLEAGDEEVPVKIKLVAPPLYVMICSAMDKDKYLPPHRPFFYYVNYPWKIIKMVVEQQQEG